MQRLHNIEKWVFAEADKAINFATAGVRKVRLDINAPGEVQLTYVDTNGEAFFLAHVKGRDVIEFTSTGEFAIIPDGPLWFYTIDGVDASFSIPDAVVLTRIAERRARNPEFELMQYEMNRNLERRLAQQRDELEQLWARQQSASPAPAVQPAPAGSGDGAVGEPAPAAGVDGDDSGDGAAA